MTHNRHDFSIQLNTQKNRKQEGLWNVVTASRLITTARSEGEAQRIADNLNADPWYLDRGQTREAMHGVRKSVERDE